LLGLKLLKGALIVNTLTKGDIHKNRHYC